MKKKKRCKWMTSKKDMARAKYNTTLITNTDDSFMTNSNSKLITKYQYKIDYKSKRYNLLQNTECTEEYVLHRVNMMLFVHFNTTVGV